MKLVLLLCFAAIQAATLPKDGQKVTLRGRVIFPDVPRALVDPEGTLTVELQDTSLLDAPAKVIAKSVGKSIRFPMAFAIKYSSKDVTDGVDYSLRVSIKDKNGDLLYTNDQHIKVTPVGLQRTKLIDAPVILVKSKRPPCEENVLDFGSFSEPAPGIISLPIYKVPKHAKRSWPELIGKDGDEAVEIIKKETGQ